MESVQTQIQYHKRFKITWQDIELAISISKTSHIITFSSFLQNVIKTDSILFPKKCANREYPHGGLMSQIEKSTHFKGGFLDTLKVFGGKERTKYLA